MFTPSASMISAALTDLPASSNPTAPGSSGLTGTASPPTAPAPLNPSAPSSPTAARRLSAAPPESSPRKGSIANFLSGLNLNAAAGGGGGGFGGGISAQGGGLASSTTLASSASASASPSTSGFGGGGGGGLGSSPNVPKPGASIDPSTGKPYMAGLTRAELDAMRTKGAGLLDPTPAHVVARRGSAAVAATSPEGRRMSEVGGREQAAAQLVGGGSTLGGSPRSPTMQKRGSIVEDFEKNIKQFQHRASSLVPDGMKDLFAEPKGKQPEGSPAKARRGSAAALFENVKNTATKIASDVSTQVQNAINEPEQPGAPRRGSVIENMRVQATAGGAESALKPATGRAPGTAGAETSILEEVKDVFGDAAKTVAAAGAGLAGVAQNLVNQAARPGEVSVAPATLPSQEKAGSQPGDFSTGVGALPGKSTEAGVAVPPDVRSAEGTAGGLAIFANAPTSVASASTAAPAISSAGIGGLAGGGIAAAVASILPSSSTKVSSTSDSLVQVQVDTTSLAPGTATAGTSGLKDHTVTGDGPRAANLAGGGIASTVANALPTSGTTVTTTGSNPVTVDTSAVGTGATSEVSGLKSSAATPAAPGLAEQVKQQASSLAATVTAAANDTVASATAPPDAPGPAPHSAKIAANAPFGGTATSADKEVSSAAATSAPAAAPHSEAIAANAPFGTSSTSSGGLPDLKQTTEASNSTGNLAQALPDTRLGQGAAKGATDLEATPGVSTASTGMGTPATGGLAAVRAPNDRASSLASVTAIHHGQPGDLHEDAPSKSPLSKITSGEPTGAAEGEKSTTRGTGPNHTTSLTPGDASQAVGHPATRDQEGTSRKPGSYPAAEHGGAGDTAPTPPSKSGTGTPAPAAATTTTGGGGAGATATPASASHSDLPKTPVTASSGNGNGNGGAGAGKDRRSSSSASSDSKKVGFMKKLKGEMKVISGKITKDEEKVELGEKIKHGEA